MPERRECKHLFVFVSGDPGAYAHNWRYAAQLLYDSADESDDGALHGSVPFSGKAAFSR